MFGGKKTQRTTISDTKQCPQRETDGDDIGDYVEVGLVLHIFRHVSLLPCDNAKCGGAATQWENPGEITANNSMHIVYSLFNPALY